MTFMILWHHRNMRRLVSQGLVCDAVSPIGSHTLIQLYLSFRSISYDDRINLNLFLKQIWGPLLAIDLRPMKCNQWLTLRRTECDQETIYDPGMHSHSSLHLSTYQIHIFVFIQGKWKETTQLLMENKRYKWCVTDSVR